MRDLKKEDVVIEKDKMNTKKKDVKNVDRNSQQIKEKRMRNRDEERAKQRDRRKRQVRMYKICISLVIVLIIGVGGGIFIWNLPSLKLSRVMAAGDKYTENGEYEKANDSYEEAIEIDSGTVEAYRAHANNDIEQDDSKTAREILYTGWENTQDESLLHYYCVVILNEAVAQINKKECSTKTIDKCLAVLQIENDNEDALNLLDICYDRLYKGSGENSIFKLFLYENAIKDISFNDIFVGGISLDDDSEDDDIEDALSPYENYEAQLRTMLDLYEETTSAALANIIAKYAVIDMEYIYFDVNFLTKYYQLLEDVYTVIRGNAAQELIECLSQAIKTQEDFADIFTEFEQGNFESAKDFIVSDTYIQIRDSFINGQSGYWEGNASVPINQEQLVIHKTQDGFSFFWPDYNDYDNEKGVITVWGSRQLDDGVQRTTISYEPASQNEEYYPHIEYVISYENSNVLKNGTDVHLNYRFNTITTTQEGAETVAIGDWGGEHEWTTSY